MFSLHNLQTCNNKKYNKCVKILTFFLSLLIFLTAENIRASEPSSKEFNESLSSTSTRIKISLPPVDCSRENVIGGAVGIRSVGKNGLRLEKENIGAKVIFHNTAHGGAGATLAPGCAQEIVRIFEQDKPEINTKVYVFGSGQIGLMTALELHSKGYRVTLYADQFPKRDVILDNNNPPMTSLIYGGLWLPFSVNVKDKVLFKKLVTTSYHFYLQAIENKTLEGLSYRYHYSFPNRDFSVIPGGLMDKPVECEVEFGNKEYFPAVQFKTIAMDANLLVNDLYDQAQIKGIKFKNRKFHSLKDIMPLKSKFVFNCLGYGAKALFQDQNIEPVLGKLLYLKPQPEIDYFMSANEGTVTVYPLPDKIVIGLTYEKGNDTLEISEEEIESLRLKAESFFKGKIRLKACL
jgi:D-amino-acid oxidase